LGSRHFHLSLQVGALFVKLVLHLLEFCQRAAILLLQLVFLLQKLLLVRHQFLHALLKLHASLLSLARRGIGQQRLLVPPLAPVARIILAGHICVFYRVFDNPLTGLRVLYRLSRISFLRGRWHVRGKCI
jgi:hypothetical protein